MGTTDHSKVILEDQKDNNKNPYIHPGMMDQLWKVGVHDNEGYFTLESGSKRKILTAISSSSLEISEGKILVR